MKDVKHKKCAQTAWSESLHQTVLRTMVTNVKLVVQDATNIPDVTFLNVDWSNNVAFVLGDGYLSSIDISNTSSLSRLDTLYDASFIGSAIETIAVDAARNVLFVGARSNGNIVKAVDYSTPTALTIAGSITNSALTGGSVVIR